MKKLKAISVKVLTKPSPKIKTKAKVKKSLNTKKLNNLLFILTLINGGK